MIHNMLCPKDILRGGFDGGVYRSPVYCTNRGRGRGGWRSILLDGKELWRGDGVVDSWYWRKETVGLREGRCLVYFGVRN